MNQACIKLDALPPVGENKIIEFGNGKTKLSMLKAGI